MASRDIANMHLFLDLKKKFPDLPDETLRNYISLFAEDQEKCINLLQKESENHYHPSQPFSDFRLPEGKVNSKRNDFVKHFVGNVSESPFPPVSLQQTDSAFSKKVPTTSGKSNIYTGVVYVPGKMLSPSMPSKTESRSAPVITSSERPFKDIYKQSSVSSHSTLCQRPSDKSNQMMFSTTKEHIIEPPVSHESIAYLPISGETEHSRKHAVKLSITPSFPFQQQHLNIFNNSVCATASHSSRPGRHTTSLNFQLQPQSSDHLPLEISTIPTNIGSPCNSRDFGSHVQISVGSQGATFTALRLQRPNYSQAQSTSHLPVTENYNENNAVPSSHAKNSSLYLFPNRVQPSLNFGITEVPKHPEAQGFDQSQHKFVSKDANVPISPIQNYQSTPNYILAVKDQQIAQLDLILNELEKEKSVFSQLKAEVTRMERELTKKAEAKSSFSYANEVHRLREEIRSLRVECSCLSMEVDTAGQIPLGVTDEDFYSNIFTGPNGAITSSSVQSIPRADAENLRHNVKSKQPSFDDDDDESNRWKCKKCTFANHPALEKCEMCELPKNSGSFFDDTRS